MPLTLASLALLPFAVIIGELTGVRVATASFGALGLAILSLAVCWMYASIRRLSFLPIMCEMALAFVGLGSSILLYSYITLRAGQPLADASLAAIDSALGFSVPKIVHWVDKSAALSWFMETSYHSLGLQLGGLPVILALCGDRDRAGRMLVGYLGVGFIGCTVSIGFPSVGSFYSFGIQPQDLTNLTGAIGYHFLESFHASRAHGELVLTSAMASGVVTFPSIHAGLAVICAWAGWRLPLLRYPVLVLNVGMLASTIPVGAHYGIDVIVGTLVAVAVVALCRRMPDTLWRAPIVLRLSAVPRVA